MKPPPAEYASFVESVTGFSDDLLHQSNLSISYLALTYRINVMANDKASVEQLLLVWHMYIARRRAGRHQLNVVYQLAGNRYEFPVNIEDSQTLSADNISHSYPEGRLFAVSVEHVVHAPVLYGHGVEVLPDMRWELGVEPLKREFAGRP